MEAVPKPKRDPLQNEAFADFSQLQALVLESMTEGVSIGDEQGYILYTNPAEDRMFGYERGELLGRHAAILNAYPPEESARIVAEVTARIKATGSQAGEWRKRKKDGTLFYTFASITSIEVRGKQYWVCVQEDITGRKLHEEALRRRDELLSKQFAELELIYRTAPVGLVFVDTQLRYVRLNQRLAEINGVPLQEHFGRSIGEVIPEIAPAVEQIYRRVLATREPELDIEVQGATAAQPHVQRYFNTSYYPVLDGGTLLGIAGVIQDITERKRAEAAVRASETQLRLVIDGMPGLVSYIGRDLRYRFVNKRYETWLGRSSGALAGTAMYDLLPERQFAEVKPYVERALGGETVTFETLNPRQNPPHNNVPRNMRITYVPDKAGDGAVQGFIALVEDITEQKKAEDALRLSEQRYRALVEASSQLVWTTNREEGAAWWTELTGQAYQDRQGGRWLEMVHPDDRERVKESWARASADHSIFDAEYRIRVRDGSYKDFLVRGVPMWNTDGSLREWFGTLTEITARKRAEEARQQLQRQLTLLIEASSTLLASPSSENVIKTILGLSKRFIGADAYSLWRKQPGGLSWSVAAVEGLSENYPRTAEEIPGEPMPSEPVAIEDIEQVPLVRRRVDAYKAEGIQSLITVPLRIHGGISGTLVFYFRLRHPFSELEIGVAAALGNLAGAALSTAELYDRETRLREQAQAEQHRATFLAEASKTLSSSLDYEATLAAVVELAVPGFADWASVEILESSGEIRALALKHCDPAKVALAREFRRRYPPREGEGGRAALKSGQSVLIEELPEALVRGRARDAEQYRMIQELGIRSIIFVPLVASGRKFGLLTFVRSDAGRRFTRGDLELAEELARRAATAVDNARLFTESKEAQQALSRANAGLRRANQDLNQFAYSASHDLQEPLRMIAVYTQVLDRRYREQLDAPARQYLDFMVQGARRMEMLLRDLLEYTQAVNIDPHGIAPVDANPVLQHTLANLNAAITECGAELNCARLPALRIREAHLLQIFQNLISNALKYRGTAAPRIEIGSERQESSWKISVKDNGIGIAPRYHEQIFGVFKRLHAAEEYPGTGIGLAICQRVVERYGGRIWVESEEGHGSTFYFTLPGAN